MTPEPSSDRNVLPSGMTLSAIRWAAELDAHCDGDEGRGFIRQAADVLAILDALEEARATIDRLRAQNKASSDAWTKRTAAMQSRIDGFDNTRRWIKSHPDWENQWLCSSFVQKIFILAFIEERLAEVRAEERARIARGETP